jgi:hypothetical protein
MAGLRAGYAIGHAPTVKAIQAYKMPYGLGTLTLGAAMVGLGNQAHIDGERKRNTEVKAFTVKAFADMGISGTDSQTNFLFMDIKRPAAGFRDGCRAQGVLVGRDSRTSRRRTAALHRHHGRCRRPSRCSRRCSAPPRPRPARNGGSPMSRVKEVSPCRSRDVRSSDWASVPPGCG